MRFLLIVGIASLFACAPQVNYNSRATGRERERMIYQNQRHNQKRMDQLRHTKSKHRKSVKRKAKYS